MNFPAFRSAICASLILAATGVFNQTHGQPEPAPTTGFPGLARAISQGFFSPDYASVGNDWCFQLESDPNETMWNFAYNNNGTTVYYPHVIDYATRMRMVFTEVASDKFYKVNSDKKESAENFSSIFMGFDLMKNSSYASFDKTPQIIAPKKPLITSSLSNIKIPNKGDTPAVSNCPSLASLLPMMFFRYIQSWRPQGIPTCDDTAGACPGVKVTLPNGQQTEYVDRQTSADTVENYSTWTFNNQTHKIPRAIRFFVLINGTVGWFVVGYGGSGGAG